MIEQDYTKWLSTPKLQKEGFPTWYSYRGINEDEAIHEELAVKMSADYDSAIAFLDNLPEVAPIVKVEPFTMLQKQVELFMRAAGQDIPSSVGFPSDEIINLREDLIIEEMDSELIPAIDNRDIVETVDAIADAVYVLIGTAIAFGIKMQDVWDEVQRSNMSKFIDGRKAPNGKWIKGPSYTPANIAPILEAQGL